MSSYSLDFSWIYEFFDPSVPVIMVAQPDATGQASLKNVLPNWIKATPVLRGGRGCQHMKASSCLLVPFVKLTKFSVHAREFKAFVPAPTTYLVF